MKNFVIFTLIFLQILSQNVVAQIIDSAFFEWTVYELQEDDFEERKCYIIAHPKKSETSQTSRSKPYIIITRYQNQRIEEFGINSGFEYKINGKVFVLIDEMKFELPTNKDMAWARNKDEDVAIIQKMLLSAKVKVRSDSAIGTFAIDEYSLKGIAKAYSRMRNICK